MPTYDYRCTCCSHELEKWQPFNADPLKVCPACGQDTLKRVLNPVGVVFKGSGYYSTDNRKKD